MVSAGRCKQSPAALAEQLPLSKWLSLAGTFLSLILFKLFFFFLNPNICRIAKWGKNPYLAQIAEKSLVKLVYKAS